MKQKRRIIGGGLLFLAVLGVAMAFRLGGREYRESQDERGAAKPSYALDVLSEEFSGESRLDRFVGAQEARGQADPVAYMIQNSTFLIDQKEIEAKVAERLSGMESTAAAKGVSVSEYLWECGYGSAEAYEEAVKEEITQFVKGRICVYQAAKELGISIAEDEYETLLPNYAKKFGFSDAETFATVCQPGTIASEMLYDKTVEALK